MNSIDYEIVKKIYHRDSKHLEAIEKVESNKQAINVIVSVETYEKSVNKSLLVLVIPLFKLMFAHPLKENSSNAVKLEKVG